MNWPPITVLIVTYNRPKEIREVIGALQANLSYPGELRWHLADDSSPTPQYIPDILFDFAHLNFTHTTTPERRGWGINVNTGLRSTTSPYIFQIEDDYVAQRPIDLERGVFVMEHMPDIGLVRYDGLEGHKLVLHVEETPRVEGRRVHFLRIDRRSSLKRKEPYGYSNRPHLKHRRFHGILGGYPEGLKLGSTEMVYAHHVMEFSGRMELAALSDGIDRAFVHVGKSQKLTAEDVGIAVEELRIPIPTSGCAGCGKK